MKQSLLRGQSLQTGHSSQEKRICHRNRTPQGESAPSRKRTPYRVSNPLVKEQSTGVHSKATNAGQRGSHCSVGQ